MKEYIERAALIDDFEHCSASKEIIKAIVDRINLHPAADVAKVRHGRWADPEDDGGYTAWYCSLCNHPVGTIGGYPNWKYCPNCGALMREDEQ